MDRWDAIRDAYKAEMPLIMESRARSLRAQSDPYIFDWIMQFTPIERNAWNDIRTRGLPFYPQVPVGRRFVDFGDPYFKIAVELDGKEWHEARRDTERDNELWALGWRTFRIPGRESFANGYEPFDPDEMLARKHCERTEEFNRWLTKTSEGLFFCLHAVYYDEGQMLRRKHHDILWDIYHTLESHRLINFPIELSEGANA